LYDFLGFVPYGDLFRKLRKLVQAPLERNMIGAYRPIQEQEANMLLMNLLQNGTDISRSVHLFVVLSVCIYQLGRTDVV
jgi:cytochrome P450